MIVRSLSYAEGALKSDKQDHQLVGKLKVPLGQRKKRRKK